MDKITQSFELAKERYAEIGVDVEKALQKLKKMQISLHCWQGDDVVGFESPDVVLTGGIMATGNYPGKARSTVELRQDAEKAFSLIPGKHRFNLHAIYLENEGKKVDRDEIEVSHFQAWIDWAKENGLGLDFNPTYFSHPKSNDGWTLSSADEGIRKFWVQHGICCRAIAEKFGEELGTPSVINFWMPDGSKDIPADRMGPRERMKKSLDEIFSRAINPKYCLDSVESKLFGIGSESYVVGSHEFFMGYAVSKGIIYCLDAGHFHPTEGIADKLTSLACFVKEILLHVSRGVRWDSDHVVIWNDELKAIAEEIVRNNLMDRVHIGLDYFDATINRLAAWVIGTRCTLRSLLMAFLEPTTQLRAWENEGDLTRRLAMMEELRSMPISAVWDYYCEQQGVPVGEKWIDEVKKYENDVLAKRS